jgi:ribokinase
VSGPQVLVVGSINVDMVVNVPELPARGQTVLGGRFEQGGGGKGANAAVAAARAGAEVVLVAAVGDDDHGRGQRAALEAHGVDVARVATVPGVATGVAFVVVAADGSNQIAVASGANDHVDGRAAAAAVDALDAPSAAVLLGFEVPDGPLVAAAGEAARHGVPIVLNPAPARSLLPALSAAHPILTPNEQEAAALSGEADPTAAAHTLARRTGAPVVVTLGAAGALVVDPAGGTTTVPAPAVEVVDTTGAGDTFSGVLTAALAARRPLLDAVAAANAAAAQSVTVPGAR